MLAKECFQAGELARAVEAAKKEVKESPSDVPRRRFLSELLCFAGDLEKADGQLDATSQLDSQQAVGVALFRQLIRAEQARRQFYSEGRLPEFLDQPSDELRARLEASILLRDGNPGEATGKLAVAEEQRPRVSGTCNGVPFDELRDLDDLTASFFEVLTSNGKYYWIPLARIELVTFEAPAQPFDLLWRRAHMEVRGGPDGEVYVPAIYAGSESNPDEQIKLGRRTDYTGGDGSPVRGIGMRELLATSSTTDAEDRVLSILEVEKIETNEIGDASNG